MSVRVVRFDGLEWITRPHEPGEAPRHVAQLSELAGFTHSRANLWRYEPGARGKRHSHERQEETFVVLAGTLSLEVGDPLERHDIPAGGLIHVQPGTTIRSTNLAYEDLLVTRTASPEG